jgi:endonuclease YncB( thermonuclease family)
VANRQAYAGAEDTARAARQGLWACLAEPSGTLGVQANQEGCCERIRALVRP